MKKFLKFIGWTILTIVLLVVLLVATLPLWLGPVVKPVANTVVSNLTGANFHLGELGLNPYVGTFHVGDVQLSNPTNGDYKADENCVELGKLDVDVDLTTVANKKIVITSIVLDGLTVRSTMAGGNFLQIADNASAATASAEAEMTEEEKEAEEEVKEEAENARVQIDKLVISNLMIKYGAVPLPVPTLTIEGIGADSEEGATLEEAGKTIFDKVMEAAGAVGGKLGDLGKDAAALGVSLGADAAEAVGDTAGKALDAVGADKAVDAIGEGAGAAVDAIGEGAGKAVDAVKSLF